MKNRAVKYGIIIGALVLVWAIVSLVIVFGFGAGSDGASKKLPEKITVQSVIGRNIADAEKLLCDIGFTVTKNEVYDNIVLKDRVISQDLTAGKKVDYGTGIKLVVSKGREQVTLPNLMGKTAVDAELELIGLGFSVEKGENFSNIVEKGKVMAQSVAAGKQADKGSDIVIIISKGQDLVKVPSVKGMALEKAEQTLKNAGLRTISEIKCSSSVAEGKIISQDIGANKNVPRDSAVTITVSAGVANVKGTTPSNAAQWGHVTTQGNWIYFCGSDNAIYRMRKDGSNTELICHAYPVSLNVVGEWIYYVDGTNAGGIYKVKIDGTGQTKISPKTSYQMYIEGDWIYHTDNWSTGKIWRMKTDGSEAIQITDDICIDFVVYGNYIYYMHSSDDLVYKCRTDGSGKTVLCPGFGGSFLTLVGNRLAVSSSYKILTVNLDGSGFTSFGTNNVQCSLLNGYNGWIYYVQHDFREGRDDTAICKVKPDGSGKTVIYEYEYPHKSNAFINVADGWVYFEKLKDSEDLYRVRIDGTGCERVG